VCWQAETWRDFDRMRTQLREDFGAVTGRPVRPLVRVAAWAALGAAAVAVGEPLLAVLAIALFEGLVAPRLGRPPTPTLGPLRPWHPPDSYRESPEAPAPWALKHS
jgi:hypothetical protein